MNDPIYEGTQNVPQQTFVKWNDPIGNPLCSINRDGTMTATGFIYAPGSNLPGSKRVGSASHILTQTDIENGFFTVPITWDSPFDDTNYVINFGIDDLYPGITLDYSVGDQHMITPDGFIAMVLCLSNNTIVQGQYDNFDTNVQETIPFTPNVTTMYQVALYLHPKTSENLGNFAGDALQASVTYTAEDPGVLTLTPSSGWNITAQDGAQSLSPNIWSTAGNTITLKTVFTTYSIPGTVLTDTWFIAGSFTGAPWAYGTTITQTGSLATAYYYGTFNNGGLAIIYRILTGVDNGGDWSHGGVTFSVTGSPTQPSPYIYGPGGGVLQQAVTGVIASELDALVGIGNEHVGPGLGAGTPDGTHAWIDVVTGGILIPSGVPTADTFHYHVSMRIIQLPSYTTQIGSEVIVNATAVHY